MTGSQHWAVRGRQRSGWKGDENHHLVRYLHLRESPRGKQNGGGEGETDRQTDLGSSFARSQVQLLDFFRFVKSINSLFKIKLVWSGFNLQLKKSQ